MLYSQVPMRVVSIEDDAFVVRFRYDTEVVQKIKTVPGRDYIAARKIWIAPPWPESAARLLEIAEEEDFVISDGDYSEIRRLADLHPSFESVDRPVGIIRQAFRPPSGGILLHVEYNPSLTEMLKEITGGYWDSRVQCLRLPPAPELARAILHCIETYDFLIEQPEYERLLLSAEEMDEDGESPFRYLEVTDVVTLHLLLQTPQYRRDMILDVLKNVTFQRGF